MKEKNAAQPDKTAVRVALWRAMHVQVDSPPHVLNDEIGLSLADPDPDWRKRPDMNPRGTARNRASIVARTRFIEDLLVEQMNEGVDQYVILGAGLDTFAQRRPELAQKLRIFEVDQPETQIWKRQRLNELGYGIHEGLHFVPVDFEAGQSLWEELEAAGLDRKKPVFIASTGVAMYLSRETNWEALRQMATLSPGSTLVMSYMLPVSLLETEEQASLRAIAKFAAMAGTPFLSFFTPRGLLAMALEAGFHEARNISARELTELYFANRTDGLRPSSAEELLVASL